MKQLLLGLISRQTKTNKSETAVGRYGYQSMMNQYLCRSFVASQILSEMTVPRIRRRMGNASPSSEEKPLSLVANKNHLLEDEGSKTYSDWLSKSTTLEDIYRHYNKAQSRDDEYYASEDEKKKEDDVQEEEYDGQVTDYVYQHTPGMKQYKYKHRGHGGYYFPTAEQHSEYSSGGQSAYDDFSSYSEPEEHHYGSAHPVQDHEHVLYHSYPSKYHVHHHNNHGYDKEKELADLFEVALTALAYLSFGMFLVHLIMSISAVTNNSTSTPANMMMPMSMSPTATAADGSTGTGGSNDSGTMTGTGGDGDSMPPTGTMPGTGGNGDDMPSTGTMTGTGGNGDDMPSTGTMTGTGGNGDDMPSTGTMTGIGGEGEDMPSTGTMTGTGGNGDGTMMGTDGNGDNMSSTGTGTTGDTDNGGTAAGTGDSTTGTGDDSTGEGSNGDGMSDTFKFRLRRETPKLTNPDNRALNELARRVLTSIEAALVAHSDSGTCLRKSICENNKFSRDLQGHSRIFIPIWSLGMSWLSGRLVKTVVSTTSMLDSLKASILGFGKANCEIIYQKCDLAMEKRKRRRRRK